MSSSGMSVNKCINEGIERRSNKIINSSLVNNSNNVAINCDNRRTDLNDINDARRSGSNQSSLKKVRKNKFKNKRPIQNQDKKKLRQ